MGGVSYLTVDVISSRQPMPVFCVVIHLSEPVLAVFVLHSQ